MKRYYLGLAANYSGAEILEHTFAVGFERDRSDLRSFLSAKYGGETFLCKNGRSALALALKAYFEPGDTVLVNGFTCYAVYEAVKAAELKPLFIDINAEDLNFELSVLENAISGYFEAVRDNGSGIASEPRDDGRERSGPKSDQNRNHTDGLESSNSRTQTDKVKSDQNRIKGIIVQNSLGNPVDIKAIEKLAKKYKLTIIEDLAHCAGVKYSDGREAGTVGAAAVLSFGKDKSIDTISGGAVVLRAHCKNLIQPPGFLPKPSDHLRARFYPLFGLMCRGLNHVHLGGLLMRLLLKLHWVEKSADNKLDLKHKISNFEAKLALRQLKSLKKSGEKPLREFYLVKDRDEVLRKLAKNGYNFSGLWYEKPVSPIRYYKKVHFPEKDCPTSTFVSEHIINLPTYYSKKDLALARKIIAENLITKKGDEHE